MRKFEEDVLAVFEDNGTTVTFITADSFALGEATDVDDMKVENYSSPEIRSYINKQAVEYLGDQLSVILNDILSSENPDDTHIENTVDRILDSDF